MRLLDRNSPLRKTHEAQAQQLLVSVCTSQTADEVLRLKAIELLSTMNYSGARETLMVVARDPSKTVSMAASSALEGLGKRK